MAKLTGELAFKPWEQWSRAGSRWPSYNVESDQADGLVGWWSSFGFEPGGRGLLRDVLGRYNMTAYNSPSVVGSEFGPVIQFVPATNHYLNYDGAILSTPPFSMMVWFNSNDATIDQTGFTIYDASANQIYELVIEGARAGDPIKYYLRSLAEGIVLMRTTTGWTANTWHHACVVTAAANDHAVFLDSAGKGTSSTTVSPINLDTTRIGNLKNIRDLSGSIAEARLYKRALSDTDVADLYNPRTRWELYQIPKRVWYVAPPAGVTVPTLYYHYAHH